jgi:PPM family protein phosphatase
VDLDVTTIRWGAAGATHVGRVRKRNEDAYRIEADTGVFVVADGMGGHAAGEVASALAADAALDRLRGGHPDAADALPERLVEAFRDAQQRLIDCCDEDPRTAGMGTTLTVAVLRAEGSLHVGHLGDSRLYHLSGGALRQLTRDHTWVQQEVDAGRVLPDAARSHPLSHILTRVLTAEEPAVPDLSRGAVSPGDRLLLCSDGLHNMVDGQQLLELLLSSEAPAEIVRRLVSAGNRAGGTDNITAIVVRID